MSRRFDTFTFLGGLICTGVAVFALVAPRGLAIADLRLIGPVAVLLLGVALLAGGARRERPEERPAETGSAVDA